MNNDLIVVGGGFTGAALALHLARAAFHPVRLTLFEPRGTPGAGLAYGTDNPSHRINVPAEKMIVFEDRPDDFLHWFLEETHALSSDPTSLGSDGHYYPRRQDFGRYMEARLAQTGTDLDLRLIAAPVMDLIPDANGVTVISADGARHRAQHAVLCNSHARPHFPWPMDPVTKALPGLVEDPWRNGALNAIPPNADVLIAGTGLTMADTVVQLLEQGHRGAITAVSRRGLLPQGHDGFEPAIALLTDGLIPKSPAELMRILRTRLAQAAQQGRPWQEVIEGLRAALPAIWPHWGKQARSQALRHLRPYWDTRRYRLSPQVAGVLNQAIAERRLRVVAGRVESIGNQDGQRFQVQLRPRGAGQVGILAFDALINCIGPDANLSRVSDPLMRRLVESGRIRPDPLGLGLSVDARFHALDQQGTAQPRLYALGPLTRSYFGEVMGVPEIAAQACGLARQLVSELAADTRHHPQTLAS